MKRCARCGLLKTEEEFNWRWTEKGVRQSICRDCQKISRRDHYERHTEAEKERAREIGRQAKTAAEKLI